MHKQIAPPLLWAALGASSIGSFGYGYKGWVGGLLCKLLAVAGQTFMRAVTRDVSCGRDLLDGFVVPHVDLYSEHYLKINNRLHIVIA